MLRTTVAVAALFLFGCDSDRGNAEGNASGEPFGDGPGDCEWTRTPLADADTVSPLGFSANEALTGKLGATETTLTFESEPTTLAEAIKGAQMPVTVAFLYQGGTVTYVQGAGSTEGGTGPHGLEPKCEDHVEIALAVTFATAGGEFNESVAVDAVAFTSDLIVFAERIMPPGLAGTFDLTTVFTDGTQIQAIDLSGRLTADEASGSLLQEIAVPGPGGGDGLVGYGPLAQWGATPDAG